MRVCGALVQGEAILESMANVLQCSAQHLGRLAPRWHAPSYGRVALYCAVPIVPYDLLGYGYDYDR